MFGKTCKVHALYLNGWINWPHPHHHVLVSYQLRNTNITSRFQHVFNSTSFTLLFFFFVFFCALLHVYLFRHLLFFWRGSKNR